jgi:hypothetical protein
MKQKEFASNAVEILRNDHFVIGLAAGGSLLSDELDDFSDIDLVLVTKEKISDKKDRMLEYANKLGSLLTAFTGDHVGEPRLLICLYDNPLLHVDIKFITLDEFKKRVEDPFILLDNNGQLKHVIQCTGSAWPHPDYQWIEDRFWTFIHYGLLKIGRGEYFEALDFLSFLRITVLGPLLHIKHGNLPRGVRKVETKLSENDFQKLKGTIATHDKQSLMNALSNAILIYKDLRRELFDPTVICQQQAEKRVMEFYESLDF